MKTYLYVGIVVLFSTAAACNKKKISKADCMGVAKEDCICTLQYDPVCGCNEVTYSNSCQARCAGVNFYTDGKCK